MDESENLNGSTLTGVKQGCAKSGFLFLSALTLL